MGQVELSAKIQGISLSRYPGLALDFFDRYFRWIAHAAGLLPAVLLVLDVLNNNLTANPIQYLTFRTGKAALVLLVLSLACTPLNIVLGLKQVLKARRTIGLYAFLYASGHATIFFVVDYGFDLNLIISTVAEKRYLLAGIGAFLILLPMAVTSFRWWQKKLGKAWKRLHQLVYLAGLLAVTHYVWVVKSDIRVPLAYGALVLLLLGIRIPAVRIFLAKKRGRLAERFR